MVYKNFTKVILAALVSTSIIGGTATTSFAQGITLPNNPTSVVNAVQSIGGTFSRNEAKIQEVMGELESITHDIKGIEREIESLTARKAPLIKTLESIQNLLDKAKAEENALAMNKTQLSPREIELAKSNLGLKIQSIIDDKQYPTEEIANINNQINRLNSDMDLVLYERKQELDRELAKIKGQQRDLTKKLTEENKEVSGDNNSIIAPGVSSRERSALYNSYRQDRLDKHMERLAATGKFSEDELANRRESLTHRLNITADPVATATTAEEIPHVSQSVRIGGLPEEAGAAAIQRAQDIIRFKELGEDVRDASTPEEREEAIMALRAQANIVRDGARGITHLDPNPTQEAIAIVSHKTPEQIAAIRKAQDIIDLRHKAEATRSATTPEQRVQAQKAFSAQADIVRNGR